MDAADTAPAAAVILDIIAAAAVVQFHRNSPGRIPALILWRRDGPNTIIRRRTRAFSNASGDTTRANRRDPWAQRFLKPAPSAPVAAWGRVIPARANTTAPTERH